MSYGPSNLGRRDANEAQIVLALQQAGCDVHYMVKAPWDITVGRAGQAFLLEVKTRKGNVRKSQEQFLASWRGHYAVVRSVEDALKAVGLHV
jgi:hypothetical protein